MNNSAFSKSQSHFHELTKQFNAIAQEIQVEKQALSLLHEMILEMSRSLQLMQSLETPGETTIHDIATLYKSAPRMEKPAESRGLAVGTVAPDFALPDHKGSLIKLSDYREKPLVLVFYPLDWSPGCSQQLDLYQQELDEFEKRGVNILAISVDSLYSHGAWAAVRGITFPLLADFHPKGEVARHYQVYRESDGFAERALYVLDVRGVIAYAHVSPYVHHVPDIYELFDVLDKLNQVQTV
jgi:peroxiredoxin